MQKRKSKGEGAGAAPTPVPDVPLDDQSVVIPVGRVNVLVHQMDRAENTEDDT